MYNLAYNSGVGRTISSHAAEIARVGGHYAVQDHAMLAISIPIESPCATSY